MPFRVMKNDLFLKFCNIVETNETYLILLSLQCLNNDYNFFSKKPLFKIFHILLFFLPFFIAFNHEQYTSATSRVVDPLCDVGRCIIDHNHKSSGVQNTANISNSFQYLISMCVQVKIYMPAIHSYACALVVFLALTDSPSCKTVRRIIPKGFHNLQRLGAHSESKSQDNTFLASDMLARRCNEILIDSCTFTSNCVHSNTHQTVCQ